MVVWGIGMNTPGDQVATFAEYMGLTFPVLYDEQGTIAEDYVLGMSFPTAAMPQDWVIGTDGKAVSYTHLTLPTNDQV